jgi:hypothetical protein
MMADRQFGGSIPVDLDPIFKHVAGKVANDSESLKTSLENYEGLHDFEEQSRLLAEIQAGVRAADILGGEVTCKGDTIVAPPTSPAPATAAPAPKLVVDIGALSAALGTVDPAAMKTNQPAAA